MMNTDSETLPLNAPHRLRSRDAIAMISCYISIVGPMLASIGLIAGLIYHVPAHPGPMDYEKSKHAMIVSGLVALPLIIASKYAWLRIMSRFLSAQDVAYLVAYGIPRRLSRLDKRLLAQWYTRAPRETPDDFKMPQEFTRREERLVRGVFVTLAVVFTSSIPSAWAYPKHSIGDWIVVWILILFTMAVWYAVIWGWKRSQR